MLTHKGWNKGLPSEQQPMYGKHHSEETKRKMSLIHKGRKFTEEHKRKIGLASSKRLRGKSYEEIYGIEKAREVKKNIGLAGKGIKNPFYGKKHTQITKEKDRLAHLGKKASEETKRKLSLAHKGKKHWNFQNWKSREPYDWRFGLELKERIREHFNRTCQLCGQKENGRRLSIHHIDYNKKNSSENNLIPLCPKCNGIVNFNREDWIDYFQNKIRSV